jgi:hypothetical protein
MKAMARLGAVITMLAGLCHVSSVAAANATSLLLPQSTAFTILGHSCGGIQEQALATGFQTIGGYPYGVVYLQTRCGTGGRGGRTITYSAWASVTWNFSGVVRSYTTLTTAPTGYSPTFSAYDTAGDHLFNALSAVNVLPANCAVTNVTYCTYRTYLSVVLPGTPTGVAATQSADQFKVTWTPDPATAMLISSSTVTAAPVSSTAPVVTTTVTGTANSVYVGPLQPQTTYSITVVSNDGAGSSPASSPISFTTPASAIVPPAPTGVTARWTAPGSTSDTLITAWTAPLGGDSPIDQYEVLVTAYDADPGAGGPYDQTVSASTLTASFAVNDVNNWSVTVRAHDAAGWGPWSTAIILGGV